MTKPFATVLGASTSLNNKTGSWRTMRPEYVKRLSPCNATCPAGQNIQRWLSLAMESKFHEAWKVIVEDNPFPAILGRVCYHTCEKVCNRGQFDGAVNINLIERSIGDIAIANGWGFEKKLSDSGKNVLVIGAGPSGLSAAYFLRMLGHNVTVHENMIKAGGMIRYGVPRYRLPNGVIDAEIKRIVDLGVTIICDTKVNNVNDEMRNFDALYVSIGAHVAAKSDTEVAKGSNVIDAVDLFRKLEDNVSDSHNLGKKVLVYGGGNTAVDAARTALRLGAESVKIVYRRTINDMSAHDIEIKEALDEGIEILCLSTISAIDGNKVMIDKMNCDGNNVFKSGEAEIMYADSVIFAIGQIMDREIFHGANGIEISENGLIQIDKNMMTGINGIFAGGDIVPCDRTVTSAIAHGKKAAKCIDAHLKNDKLTFGVKQEVANFKKLNINYFKENPRRDVSRFGDVSFNEKDISYSSEEIVMESARCFSCGNCSHCDNCYGYCPDNAIIKHHDGSLEINYDYCKGCGICAAECPCGAVKMV